MKRIRVHIVFIILMLGFFAWSKNVKAIEIPDSVYVSGQKMHVQGLAIDLQRKRMYFSFTTSLVMTDFSGNILGSIDNLDGHLGDVVFDQNERKLYASFERKDDEIGKGIASKLGTDVTSDPKFYIATIDVDNITGKGISQKQAITLTEVKPAIKDYSKEVTSPGGVAKKHKYGCSGIDGITIAPGFGEDVGEKYLYVAYGIYSDLDREDNDYQVLLRYRITESGISKSCKRYFIKTGNTNYGVQNLAYDPATNLLFMAVYRGKKSSYKNYDLFTVDMKQAPCRAKLDGVGYAKSKKQLNVTEGWIFPYGSTGMCPLGDGSWFISENGVKDSGQFCNARLYLWNGDKIKPFEKVGP